eukprot:GHVS01007715.1.p2 GENE.GHVS01007715.1~~GHVS01007715.1.p2  ORF type:complete len:120 (+),score=16.58 GHVS01007715.1:328-687(+)
MAASLYYVFLLCLLAWTSAKAAEDVGGRPRRNLFDSSSSSVGHSSSEGTSSSGESQTSSSSGESQTSSSSAEGCCSGQTIQQKLEDIHCQNGIRWTAHPTLWTMSADLMESATAATALC